MLNNGKGIIEWQSKLDSAEQVKKMQPVIV